MLVEHQRGIMRAFDEHLNAVSDRRGPRSRTSTTPSRGPRSPAGNRGRRGPARAEDRRAECPTEAPVQGRDDVAAVAARRRRMLRADPSSPRHRDRVSALELHVAPRPDPRGSRPRPHPRRPRRAAADHAARCRTPAAPPRSKASVSPAPTPNAREPRRARAAAADEHRKPSLKEKIMRDIATATLSGNLTRDVELQALPSGTDVARLRVATTTRRRTARSGSRRPTTSPSRCTAPRRATARSTCARARASSSTRSSTGASGPTSRTTSARR